MEKITGGRCLTPDQNREGHRAMWLELARTGGGGIDDAVNYKHEAMLTVVDEDTIYHNMALEWWACFACNEAMERTGGGKELRCPFCPLKWGVDHCERKGSLYFRWRWSIDVLERRMLAMQIAYMEWF